MQRKNILIISVIGIVILAISLLFVLNQAKIIQLTQVPAGLSVLEKRYEFPRDWYILENKLTGNIVLPEGADLKWIYAMQGIGKGCGYNVKLDIKDGVKVYSSTKGLSSCESLFYSDPGSSDQAEYQHYEDYQIDFRTNGLTSKTLDYSITLTPTESDPKYTPEMLYPLKIYLWEMVECRVNTQCGSILMPGTNSKVQTICDQVYHACRIPTNAQEHYQIIQPPVTPPVSPGEPTQPPYVEPPKPPTKIKLWVIIGVFLLIIGGILFIFRKIIFKRK